jgi:DNA invertase Pin-like site-specific DNA recombinase
MKAIGYVRVSTQEQAEEGVSVAAQTAKVRAQAIVSDLELLDVIVDAGASGKDLKRTGIERVIRMVKAREVQAIVVPKIDRLTRSVRDLIFLIELLDKLGVRLISLHETLDTSTATGRMVITIIGAVAQMEREQIGERTRAALNHKKQMGERVGTLPYGFGAGQGPTLERNEQEQAIIDLILKLRSEGQSFRAIAEELNSLGHNTRTGGPWKHQYVASIVSKHA